VIRYLTGYLRVKTSTFYLEGSKSVSRYVSSWSRILLEEKFLSQSKHSPWFTEAAVSLPVRSTSCYVHTFQSSGDPITQYSTELLCVRCKVPSSSANRSSLPRSQQCSACHGPVKAPTSYFLKKDFNIILSHIYILVLSTLAQSVRLLPYIQQVNLPHLDQNTGYSDRGLSWFCSVSNSKYSLFLTTVIHCSQIATHPTFPLRTLSHTCAVLNNTRGHTRDLSPPNVLCVTHGS
jgi:hypothetical protein